MRVPHRVELYGPLALNALVAVYTKYNRRQGKARQGGDAINWNEIEFYTHFGSGKIKKDLAVWKERRRRKK